MRKGKINSRQKGARGERQWRDELRANGYQARRGQQFSGSPDSPDVVCPALPWIHFEVKAVERLNIEEAMEKARRDAVRHSFKFQVSSFKENSLPVLSDQCSAGAETAKRGDGETGKVAIVAHRRNFRPWLVTMEAETFFRLLRDDLPNDQEGHGAPRSGLRRRNNQRTEVRGQRADKGTGDPRAGLCRGGTGQGGGDGDGQGREVRGQRSEIRGQKPAKENMTDDGGKRAEKEGGLPGHRARRTEQVVVPGTLQSATTPEQAQPHP